MRHPIHVPQVQQRRACTAFTLVELCIAVAVGVLVCGVVLAMTTYTGRTFAALGNYSDLDRSSRLAVDTITTDIRQARVLTSYATNQLVFTDTTNGTFSYTWDPQDQTLTRVYNGQSRVLLTSCASLMFHISQRTPSNNFEFWPATAVTNAKMVDVSWTCSRSVMGQLINSESVQTAKITIRN
jgi:hypothetical protein